MKLQLPSLSAGGAFTVLLITQDQLVRADFSGKGGKSKGLWRRPRPMGEELPAVVDAALRLGKKKPKRVWILASELWTQVLSLHASATQGINDAELSRALTFEAEALSGLSAFDSEAAFVPAGSDGAQRLFWILQLPRWQRDQIDEIVRTAGGKLAGMAHPGGLPAPLDEATTGPWQRTELWSNVIVGVEGRGSEIIRTHVINADARSRGWQAEFTTWKAAGLKDAAQERLAEDATLDVSEKGEPDAAVLDSDETIGALLARWSTVLAAGKAAAPIVAPAVKPLTRQQRSLIAAGLAAVAGAVVGFDYYTMHREIDAAKSQVAGINAEKQRLEGIKKQSVDIAKEKEKSQKDLDAVKADVTKTEATFNKYRTRHARLLALLSGACPDDLMIDSVIYENGHLILAGMSIGPDSPNELASSLGHTLREIGWQVQPARKVAGEALVNNGEPWDFELELHDLPAGVKPLPTMTVPWRPAGEPAENAEPAKPEQLEALPKHRLTNSSYLPQEL
jgi:hypothetical protein